MAVCPLHPEVFQGDSETCKKCGQIIVKTRASGGKTIEKKILREYFDAIKSGKKKYELRLADFSIAEGDCLRLREWDPDAKQYTGREITKAVTYVRKFDIEKLFWSTEEIKKNGLYILSLE